MTDVVHLAHADIPCTNKNMANVTVLRPTDLNLIVNVSDNYVTNNDLLYTPNDGCKCSNYSAHPAIRYIDNSMTKIIEYRIKELEPIVNTSKPQRLPVTCVV